LSSADGLSLAAEAGCVMRKLFLMKMPTEDEFNEKIRRRLSGDCRSLKEALNHAKFVKIVR